MITTHIEAVLLITGVCTAGALVLFLAPVATAHRIFGEVPAAPLGTGLMRHWGLLLFCIGALLVYAALDQAVRGPAMLLASVEKLGFAGCVFGTSLRQRPMVSFMAAADVAMVLLYALYFLGA